MYLVHNKEQNMFESWFYIVNIVISQVPYKPKFIWYPGEHRMPGGEFPFPPAVADLCQFMPPPLSFQVKT